MVQVRPTERYQSFGRGGYGVVPFRYKFCELYECRCTMLIGCRLQVKVYEVLLQAMVRSRY